MVVVVHRYFSYVYTNTKVLLDNNNYSIGILIKIIRLYMYGRYTVIRVVDVRTCIIQYYVYVFQCNT